MEREGEERGEPRIIEILEFSCPYGCISHGRNTLEKTYEAKKAKYEELAQALRTEQRGEVKVRVTAVIVSSMGAVYGQSMKDLQKVLRCNDKEMKKLARQMSETVIVGSMEIWRKNAQEIAEGTREDVNELIAEKGARMEEARIEMEMELAREQERERNIANIENDGNGLLNERQDDFGNENDEDVEEFEDEDENEDEEEDEEEDEGEEDENEDEEGEAKRTRGARGGREEVGNEAVHVREWRIREPEEGIPGRRNEEEIQRSEIVEPEEGEQLGPLEMIQQALSEQGRTWMEVGTTENPTDDEGDGGDWDDF
jgi:hypothetical protein